MDERPAGDEDRDTAVGESGMREGLDREYASMGTGEAGAGVGGGGASSSDVEWDAGTGTSDDASHDESPGDGTATGHQDVVGP